LNSNLPKAPHSIRSYLKKVFWPPAFFGGIGDLIQILEILEYSSGLKHGSAAILYQNPFFEMASILYSKTAVTVQSLMGGLLQLTT